MVNRRPCPACGSKRWHKEPSSGLIACSEGHILQNYRNETNEAEDVGNHMMKKRTVKANKKKKERKSKADPKLYHGSNGRYLYFQCQQLILRKQVAFLAKLWDLPQEFEMVCRDLWALHLSLLPDPPPSEPYFDNASTPNDLAKVEGENPGKRHSRSPSPETQPTGPDISDSVSSTSSDDNSDSEERDQDPELAEFMRENSESDGDDDDDDDVGEIGDDKDSYEGKGQARGRRGHNMYEKPTNNLAVLIVALWTLRIPVMYIDLIRLVESYKLPYLDPVRLLPLQMVSHLTKYNIQALSPAHAPKTLTLHTLTSRLAMQLYNSYMILTPEGNAAPLLWRVTQGMGGTPTLYALTKRLSHRLSLPLALHKSLVPKLLQIESREAQTRRYDNAPVEGSLLAAVIVVLKMVYGLDGENRSPRDSDDPAFALPCLDDYLGRVGDLHDADPRREAVFNSEKPIFMDSLNDDILDEYLAFCERIALRPSDNTSQEELGQMVANYFSLDASSSISAQAQTAHALSPGALKGQFEQPNNERRPGEKYTIFHSRDLFGTVPEEYEKLVKRGSDLIGVPEDYINGLVEKFERRKLWKK